MDKLCAFQPASHNLLIRIQNLVATGHLSPSPSLPVNLVNPQRPLVHLEPRHLVCWNDQCGLERPSAKGFREQKDDIVAWFEKEYNAFLDLPKESHPNFVLYLQQKWAPKALSSGIFCDSVGSCSIFSCLNLIDKGSDLGDGGSASDHDRQMALYVFEWLANTDHVFAEVEKKLQEGLQELINTSDRFVDEFSSAKRIQDAVQKEYKERNLGLQIGLSLALVAGGVAGVAGGAAAGASAAINLIVGLFFFMLFLFGV